MLTKVIKKARMCPVKWDKFLCNFEIQADYSNWTRRQNLVFINKEKITFHQIDFAVSPDHILKVKENDKLEKYLDLARELKKKMMEYESNSDTNHS